MCDARFFFYLIIYDMKKIFISSAATDTVIKKLKKYGYAPVLLPPSPFLPDPVASHPDMLLCRLGDKLLVCEYYKKANPDIFVGEKLILSDEIHGDVYPDDILFNCFEFRGKMYCKQDHISKHVTEYCCGNGIEIVDLKQGYAKCSCIVTPEVCITADANILKNTGDSCVPILKGSVELPGYDTGFIGGASFYDNGNMYFFGSLNAHADGEKIKRTLEQNGIGVIELSNGTLTDLGGAIL